MRIIGITLVMVLFLPFGMVQARQQDAHDYPENIALSPDETLAAVAYGSGKIEIWEIETQELVRTLTEHRGPVFPLTWSEDGTTLLSGSADGTIRQWDVATGANTLTIELPVGFVDVDWYANQSQIIAAGANGGLFVFDAVTGAELYDHTVRGYPLDMVWSPNGQHIAFPIHAGLIEVLDNETLDHVASVGESGLEGPTFSENMLKATWSPDGTLLAGGNRRGRVQVWRFSDGQSVLAPTPISDSWFATDFLVRAISFSADGEFFRGVSADGTLTVWDIATGEKVQSVSLTEDYMYAATFNHDGTQVIYTPGESLPPVVVDIPPVS